MPCIFSFVENIDVLQAVLLVVGLVFLVIEAFVPGFGIFGALGIASLVLTIFLTAKTLMEGIIMFLILFVVSVILLLIAIRVATKGKLSKKLINRDTSSEKEGYLGMQDERASVGLIGKAFTILRPAGKGIFNGEVLDIVTKGEFIEIDKDIIIEQVEGVRIVVREYKGE